MRARGYGVFELLAWPALAWGTIELGLRLAVGERDGLADALLVVSMAAGTIVFARLRRRQLAVPDGRARAA